MYTNTKVASPGRLGSVAPIVIAPTPPTTVARAPTPPQPPAQTSPFTVIITKGEHGIGLDIGRAAENGCVIQRLKEMPAGVENPASKCVPALNSGDMIIGVNGTKMVNFNDIVKAIRSGGDDVKLLISRPSK